MKVVALVSGGKDSCLNVLKCLSYGHELCCFAHLSPVNNKELNSFMYQSAASNALPFLSLCFGVPLVQRSTLGHAVAISLDYEITEFDEVEDLYLLLVDVIAKYPDVRGVSCGAILSTYQRLRVENVCQRLGLTPLTYLWQQEQDALLEEIIDDVSMTAILVKVAGAGLDPMKHLGKSLSLLRPTLRSLHQRLGLDLCGEGGEYETLVLDCQYFSSSRLSLIETRIVLDEEDSSVGNLEILRCELEAKDGSDKDRGNSTPRPLSRRNFLLEMNARAVAAAVPWTLVTLGRSLGSCPRLSGSGYRSSSDDRTRTKSSSGKGLDGWGQTPLVWPLSQGDGFGSGDMSQDELILARKQMRCVLRRMAVSLAECLPSHPVSSEISERLYAGEELTEREDDELKIILCNVFFVRLYLSDMKLFSVVNEEYCLWFVRCSPPSRACVQISFFPSNTLVAADAQFLEASMEPPTRSLHCALEVDGKEGRRRLALNRLRRDVLHVRSMSEWAPVCIGPYSQANTIAQFIVFVAGQIPLCPGSMNVLWYSFDFLEAFPPPLVATQTRSSLDDLNQILSVQLLTSLRHALRVLQASNSSLKDALTVVVWVNTEALTQRAGTNDVDIAWHNIRSVVDKVVRKNCFEKLRNEKNTKNSASNTADKWFQNSRAVDCIIDSDEECDDEFDGFDGFDEGNVYQRSSPRGHECTEETASGAKCALPVLVVGVSGLPRDVLVEVEVVALTHLIPSDIVESRWHTSKKPSEILSESSLSVYTDADAFAKTTASWPMWCASPSTPLGIDDCESFTVALNTRDQSAQHQKIDIDTSLYATDSVSKYIGRTVCSGFTTLHFFGEEEDAESLLAAPGFYSTAACLLTRCLLRQVRSAEMPTCSLRSLRIFANTRVLAGLDLSSLQVSICNHLEREFNLKGELFPLVLLPARCEDKCLLSAQFMCIDLIQANTLKWIYSAEDAA